MVTDQVKIMSLHPYPLARSELLSCYWKSKRLQFSTKVCIDKAVLSGKAKHHQNLCQKA